MSSSSRSRSAAVVLLGRRRAPEPGGERLDAVALGRPRGATAPTRVPAPRRSPPSPRGRSRCPAADRLHGQDVGGVGQPDRRRVAGRDQRRAAAVGVDAAGQHGDERLRTRLQRGEHGRDRQQPGLQRLAEHTDPLGLGDLGLAARVSASHTASSPPIATSAIRSAWSMVPKIPSPTPSTTATAVATRPMRAVPRGVAKGRGDQRGDDHRGERQRAVLDRQVERDQPRDDGEPGGRPAARAPDLVGHRLRLVEPVPRAR